LNEISALRERLGFAILFITHDLSLLVELADSIAIMYAGRIVEQAPAADLFGDPLHPYTVGLVNSFPRLHGSQTQLVGIPGFPPDLRALPSGCTFRPRCSWAMPHCASDDPDLMPIPQRPGALGARTVACWRHHVAVDGPAGPDGAGGPESRDVGEQHG
jgi:peptide/nickel transport system ATP-binding protein